MIAVCSLFRDNARDVERCFADRARWNCDHSQLIHVCVEGDSVDGTKDALLDQGDRHGVVVSQFHSGAPRYPSVIEPERMSVLGRTSNRALEIALTYDPTHILWLDSDITTPPDLIPSMLTGMAATGAGMIAPMFYFADSVYVRDTWGYRSASGEFTNRPPFCPEYDDEPFLVHSVGLPLIDAAAIRAGARFSEVDEIVGLCRSVRQLGFTIYCHPGCYAEHPRMGTQVPPIYERSGAGRAIHGRTRRPGRR